jgi:hypothetical protein
VSRLAPGALLAAVVLAGCSHPATHAGTTTTTVARSAAAGLSKTRALLPPGFDAPGHAAPAATVANLVVAPAAGFQPSSVHLAAFPSRSAGRPILESVVNLPVPLTVGPLFASTPVLQPGGTVIVAAAHLAPGAAHPVLFVLEGPGYRGEHLVDAADGVAAGVVHLPATMSAGTWYLVVEDQSQLTPTAAGGLTGSAVVALGVLTVK